MQLCPIASGSSGNCIYVGSKNVHLLVDTGISKKRVEEGLDYIGLSGHDIDAILIHMSMVIIFKDWASLQENIPFQYTGRPRLWKQFRKHRVSDIFLRNFL